MKSRKNWIAWITLAVLLAGGALAYAKLSQQRMREHFEATDITGVEWGRDFHLTGDDGMPHDLAEFRGKVVAVYFGYTSCPDTCPTTLANLAQAVRQLGAEGQRVQGLFITVDPAHDTRAVLADYVHSFSNHFIGLYGDERATRRTAAEFKVEIDLPAASEHDGHSADHSAVLFVFDSHGRLRLALRPEAEVNAVTHDLRLLLRESA